MEPAERGEGRDPAMRTTSDYDGIVLYEWMWSPDGLGLPLTSADLMIYSKVYAVSHHSTGAMTASQPKLAQLFGLSRETVNRTLRRLIEDGLVYVCGTVRASGQGGRPVNVYAVCQAPIERAVTGCRSMAEQSTLPEVRQQPSTNVTGRHIPSGERDSQSHSNVTREANVTERHVRENGAQPAQKQTFQQSPLISKTNPDPKDGGKRRELTETEFLAFRKLLSMSLKPVQERYEDEARGLFSSCIDEGIAPETLLTAYGRYSRQLIASRNAGGRYFPMTLTHFLMRNKGTEDDPKHNSWIEDARAEAAAASKASGKETKILRDVATDLWIAFPHGAEPEYIQGVGPGATREQALEAWESSASRKEGLGR